MENRKLTNIHCHGLFGVDDGPESLKQAKGIMEAAIKQNIGKIIFTPHFDDRIDTEIKDKAREALSILKGCYPQMEFYLGSEIFCSSYTLDFLESGQALTMAGTRYILIEFQYDCPYREIYQQTKLLIEAGYKPIIAHTERYEALFKREERVKELILLGAYIQVNSRSFVGWKMNKRHRWVMRLLKTGKVHFIADDSHDDQQRKPLMKEVYDKLANEIEKEILEQIFYQNPEDLLNGKVI